MQSICLSTMIMSSYAVNLKQVQKQSQESALYYDCESLDMSNFNYLQEVSHDSERNYAPEASVGSGKALPLLHPQLPSKPENFSSHESLPFLQHLTA